MNLFSSSRTTVFTQDNQIVSLLGIAFHVDHALIAFDVDAFGQQARPARHNKAVTFIGILDTRQGLHAEAESWVSPNLSVLGPSNARRSIPYSRMMTSYPHEHPIYSIQRIATSHKSQNYHMFN
ncbi:hypothetical protein QCA50_016980 [Cerrena zonata]|uniref:Uncharacterized protein n=1 Tax=Cerrena zonata TaxID=2478898 RepID=A0AAW0FP53_9APHY